MLQAPSSFLQFNIAYYIPAIIGIVAVAAIVLYFVLWALRKKPVTGVESLRGKDGVVVRDLVGGEIGEVSVDGVIWEARIQDGAGSIKKGEDVVVTGISSLVLLVQKK